MDTYITVLMSSVASDAGIIQIERAAAPNDHPIFISAMADVVQNHIKKGPVVSLQFLSRCPHCVSPRCKSSKEFYKKLCNMDTEANLAEA